MAPVSPTARSASARPPTRRGRKAPPATVVLLVRHGVTPTTGKMLPGQAAGLHLADKGHEQAGAAAGRIAALTKPPTAVYASPLERTRVSSTRISPRCSTRRVMHGRISSKGEWPSLRGA